MAATRKRKRKASPAQLAALAKGRAKMAAKRGGRTNKRKSSRRSIMSNITTGVAKVAKRTRRKSSGGKRRRSCGGGRMSVAGMTRGLMPLVRDGMIGVSGGVLAGMIANKLPLTNDKLKAVAPVIASLAVAMTIGKKRPIARQLAAGMFVVGGVAMLKKFFPQVPLLAGEDVVYLPYSPETGNYVVNDGMSGNYVDLGADEDVDEFVTSPDL